MSKPWEKFAETPKKTQSPLPWEKFASTTQHREKSLGEAIADSIADVPRQIGLTGRHALEGLAQMAQPFTEPVRQFVTDPALRAVGLLADGKGSKPLMEAVSGLADATGLPSPKNATERVVGDAARMMAGGAGFMGAAGKAAQGASGVAQGVLQGLSSNPVQQLISATGAGVGGGAVREAGGSPIAQATGAILGGLGSGLAAQGVVSLGQNVMRRFSPENSQNATAQLEKTLKNAGVSWDDVPDSLRQSLLNDAEKAIKTGSDLEPVTLSRLLDFKRVGATPTRGTLTLDPVQITREQNLSRIGADALDTGLHGLARIQNNNNKTLIDNVNKLGAANSDDVYAIGNKALDALQVGIDAEKANINQLYSAARDTAGRSAELNRSIFTQNANDLLDSAMVGGALPSGVRQHLNRIATGKVPFDVNYAEQLKTQIGKLQRSSNDGQTRYALGLVRQALDDTPLLHSNTTSGIPVGVTVPAIRAAPSTERVQNLGEEAITAFNQARTANSALMRRIEANPALKALYDGNASPDDFLQKFIISKSAKTDDVQNLAKQLKNIDPEAVEAVRGGIAQHLKAAAIGNGTADEVGRFSASNFRKALQSIGNNKMSAFFTKDEIAQFRAVSNVANYTSLQPVGSAVNNSNSGALIVSRGIDMLDQIGRNVRIFGIAPTLNNVVRGFSQRSAQNISPALIQQNPNSGIVNTLVDSLSPAAIYGGASYLTPTDARESAEHPSEKYRYRQ